MSLWQCVCFALITVESENIAGRRFVGGLSIIRLVYCVVQK